MLGRGSLVRRIKRHLLKPTPDHVSVVGPKHYGKSVLLRHLADACRAGSSGYLTTVHIDLRHDTPGSDDAFKRRLAVEIKKALREKEIEDALRPNRTQLSEYIDLDDAAVHESLDLVFTELEGENARMLVVLDGFDYALAGTELTRNLWDQLRSLAQKSSLRLVTGSRRPLRELCRTEESRTSDFWEIFYDTPVRVAALDDSDRDAFLQPFLDAGCFDDSTEGSRQLDGRRPGLCAPSGVVGEVSGSTNLDDSDRDAFLQPFLDAGCTFDDSARKEVANWTGGVPLLVCALLRELWEKYRGARISKPEIDQTADAILKSRREILAELWDDCDIELRADLGTLADGDIPLSDLSADRRHELESRGFGRVSGENLRGSCRLIQRYAEEQAPALADLTRLFGTTVGFEAHVQTFLELRLKQAATPKTDQSLHDFVSRAIEDIGRNPELAINGIRGIADRALALIWEAELPHDRTLPKKWIDEWKRGGEKSPPEDRGKLPSSSGAQCQILRLITGSAHISRQSRYITKTTYLLVNHLKSVGDFGQHRGDYPETTISVGFAATVVLAAISLIESLTTDLQRDGD